MHLVHLVEDEHGAFAVADVASDPLLQLRLRRNSSLLNSHCASAEESEATELIRSLYLVGDEVSRMREVKCGGENVHKVAVHSLPVDVFGDQLAHVVLPRAGPSVQRENQGLLRRWIVDETVHSF